MPADAVPADVCAAMDVFVGGKDVQAVATFVSALIDSAFEGVPAAAGSSKTPAKANVRILITRRQGGRAGGGGGNLQGTMLAIANRMLISAIGRQKPHFMWSLA